MAITLNGTTGITTPDINTTAQSTDITTTGDISAVDVTASGGVYLGGTAAANYLDDYEEGTWTPAYTGSSGSATYSAQTGVYTKIGRVVNFSGILQAGRNTLSGSIDIAGLPFSATEDGSGMYIGFGRNFTGLSSTGVLRGYVVGTQIELRVHLLNATGSTTLNSSDMGTGTSDNYLYFSGSYNTTA